MFLYIKSFLVKKESKIYMKLFTLLFFLFFIFLSVRQYYVDLKDYYHQTQAFIEIYSRNDITKELKELNKNMDIKTGAVLDLDLENGKNCTDITNCDFAFINDKEYIYVFEKESLVGNDIIIPFAKVSSMSSDQFSNKINKTFNAKNIITEESYSFKIKEYEENDLYFFYVSDESYNKLTQNEYMNYIFIDNLNEKELYDCYDYLKENYADKIEYIELRTFYIPPFQFLDYYTIALIFLSILFIILSCVVIKNMISDFNQNDKLYKIIGYNNAKIMKYRIISSMIAIIVAYIIAMIMLLLTILIMNIFGLLPIPFLKLSYILFILVIIFFFVAIFNIFTKVKLGL